MITYKSVSAPDELREKNEKMKSTAGDNRCLFCSRPLSPSALTRCWWVHLVERRSR